MTRDKLEYDELPEPDAVAALVTQMVAAMMVAEFPPDGVVSQFGVSLLLDPMSIGLSNRDNANFMVTVYHKDRCCGLPKRWFDEVRKELDDAVGVINFWNGQEGHDGVSVVLGVVMTDDYLRCYANYVGLTDQHEGMAAFHKEWARAFQEVTGQSLEDMDSEWD